MCQHGSVVFDLTGYCDFLWYDVPVGKIYMRFGRRIETPILDCSTITIQGHSHRFKKTDVKVPNSCYFYSLLLEVSFSILFLWNFLT